MTCRTHDEGENQKLITEEQRIRNFVKSLGEDFHDRIKALANDPDYRPGPRAWLNDPDPFGMNWDWLQPKKTD